MEFLQVQVVKIVPAQRKLVTGGQDYGQSWAHHEGFLEPEGFASTAPPLQLWDFFREAESFLV